MIRIVITFILSFFLFVTNIFAQDYSGDWYGKIAVQSQKLRINFHVTKTDDNYISTMDSPDQNAFNIATDKTSVDEKGITISIKNMMLSFTGKLQKDIIKGTFSQSGMDFPLNLSHQKTEKTLEKKKPQEPVKPYPYLSEEITFKNKKANNIQLAGTLTLPKDKKKPAVAILITGSGPQNRNEEILGHKPFLVIADYLTRNGIAVLRFDDRGVGKSEGTQKDATSADFATDVEAAINYLKTRKDINCNKIGLIGHSEGGFIAPMVASKNKEVSFIILLAGTGVDGAEVLISQSKRAMELAATPKEHIDYNEQMSKELYALVKKEKDQSKLKEALSNYLKKQRTKAPLSIASQLTDTVIQAQVQTISSPWFTYFIRTNPQQFLKHVTCPVLALNGSKDFQVIADLNLNGIKKALNQNNEVTIKKLEGLNHLFQTCKTGAFNEYAQIDETFSPKVLKIMVDWINKRF